MPGSQKLKEFIAAGTWRGGSSAWCCHAVPPELMAEVEGYVAECERTGVAPHWRAIAGWLTERGCSGATPSKVYYHFDRGHHRRQT